MRLEGWQEKLWAELEDAKNRPFLYGSHDCCIFAARCVDSISGTTFAADLANHYVDEPSAMAYLAGFNDLEAAVSSWMGESTAANWAGPGDVILAQINGASTIGVCLGMNCAFSASPVGLQYASRDVITRCWRVL